MTNLRVSIVQSDLIWEDVSANLSHHYELIKNLKGKTDLIVLPEMFTTGFSLQVKQLAQTMNSKTIDWLTQTARELNVAISGSVIIQENDNFYNRHFFVHPDQKINYYDKRHLFRMGDEHKRFTAGSKQVIVNYKNWRINLLTCYDLRFPVWSRNRNNYDLAIYVANWPDSRKFVWNTLLSARAIENQIYVIGVNRVGIDGMNLNYSGNSKIIHPKGHAISEIEEYKQNVITTKILKSELEDFRKAFPVLLDSDRFEIEY
ncbi:MAG TPA: amidohydrolase [Bacteroidales bacterium]|nr:MAG: hypothetical protein A2W98_05880 [Bacteroidetes bacterium GWF2_33_38]OFY92157.1 MAG: hypothetical protein A2236_07555 [Bacteroidetes bacterium RIFOXYA2_FULL_33_7]HBF88336.1 amidohydrolase [Bacteroidales bacterium]